VSSSTTTGSTPGKRHTASILWLVEGSSFPTRNVTLSSDYSHTARRQGHDSTLTPLVGKVPRGRLHSLGCFSGSISFCTLGTFRYAPIPMLMRH